MLLTRDQFREQSLKRDKYACVVCSCKDNLSVHHILERKLFPDGGYYLDNAASLCEKCHLLAENTEYSVEFIRKAAKVNVILPPGFDYNVIYDKWGNEILGEVRIKGPLYSDPGPTRLLKHINFMENSKKYPRTYHLPFSPGATNDDKIMDSYDHFHDQEIVISQKFDGSNVCLEREHCFARTHSGPPTHASFDMFKSLHAGIKSMIPESFQIFGEWLYAKHSIHYHDLPGYLMIFGIRYNDVWLSWEETELWAEELGISTVTVEFIGKTNDLESLINKLMKEESLYGEKEGMVVRFSREFNDENFSTHCSKYVREHHIQTSDHWKDQEIVKNGLNVNLLHE